MSPESRRSIKWSIKSWGETMALKTAKRGRKSGGANKGFFFRKDKGWTACHKGSLILLRDDRGNKFGDPKTPAKVLKEAHRLLLNQLEKDSAERATRVGNDVPMAEICRIYLEHSQ